MSEFDVRGYWEDRLSADWSLQSVGFRRMGKGFNESAYRLRRERFETAVREFLPAHDGSRVLDIGSGTGFYIDAWRQVGVREVVGMDITEGAVRNLRERYPEVEFLRNDVTAGTGGLVPESFDIVSAMDVMFHIVDHDGFATALKNIASLLRPGGRFIWSDFFIHGREEVSQHIAWRSLYRVEELLSSADFEIVARIPLFFWMNEPRDTQSGLVLWAWKGCMWVLSQSESLSSLGGHALYHLDRYLAGRLSESPSTEIMICQKRQW